MLVLGVDPGLRVTGYGLVERQGNGVHLVEAGTIDSGDEAAPLQIRLRALYLAFAEIVDEYRPQAVAMEQLYSHYAHPRTAILMGHARGVLCLVAGMHDIPLHDYPPTEVKSRLTGNGRASKGQIQRMVQRTFGLEALPEPPDVADAVAIALCHLYSVAESPPPTVMP